MDPNDLILLQDQEEHNINNVAIDNNHVTMLSYDEKDRPYSIDGSKFQMMNRKNASSIHT
jgi:hypothetical protein